MITVIVLWGLFILLVATGLLAMYVDGKGH